MKGAFIIPKYYQINTITRTAKPITDKQAINKTINREFIPWYESKEIVFIADMTEDYKTIKEIVCSKLEELGMTFDNECFYDEESSGEVFYGFSHTDPQATISYLGLSDTSFIAKK